MGMKLTDKEVQRMDYLKGRIEKYDTTLKAVDATMGKHTRHVGNYERANNGLGMSLAQITREMPAFANSAQTDSWLYRITFLFSSMQSVK